MNAQVVSNAGAGGSKALKLSFKSLGYVPNEDTFTVALSAGQAANTTGMRIWLKGTDADFIRRQLKVYTNHVDASKTEEYRTNNISVSESGDYVTVYWGDQAAYNWYHNGASAWNYSFPTVEQCQSGLFKIGINFAVTANTGAQEIYIDNIELLQDASNA